MREVVVGALYSSVAMDDMRNLCRQRKRCVGTPLRRRCRL